MKHTAWILFVAATACSFPAVAQAEPASEAARMRIERGLLPPVQVQGEELRYSIEERLREHRVPAVSIAVFADFQLQWAQAYGLADVEAGARATEETLFLAGSISKSVNALGVLLAAADGTLSLDQPVNELLESWKLPDNELTRATPVTLRRLLSHTAGTTVHGFPGYAAGEPVPTVQQILDGVAPANTVAVRVDLAPGSRFRYSGGGTTITQLALSERSKLPYAEVLAERVLKPLGMLHSTFEQALPPERLKFAAAGYDREGGVIAGKRHAYPEMGAAGLWTTASDLARFFLEVARARAGRPSPVPDAIAQELTSGVIEIGNGTAVGLGVFLTGRHGARFFGHDGADAGFQALALASLDGGYGLVVLANSDNGFALFPEVERAVFAEYGWPGADPKHVRIALEPEQRARFTGEFLLGRLPAAITDADGTLWLRAPFREPIELIPVAPDRLIERNDGAEFRIGASGTLEVLPPGEPARTAVRLTSPARHHLVEIEAGRFAEAVAAWREQLQAAPQSAAADETTANNVGYSLMDSDVEQALAVFQLVATVFPGSSNAHDSLAEACVQAGDKPRAIAAYEASLKTLDADERIPAQDKAARRRHGEEQLAKLRAP